MDVTVCHVSRNQTLGVQIRFTDLLKKKLKYIFVVQSFTNSTLESRRNDLISLDSVFLKPHPKYTL